VIELYSIKDAAKIFGVRDARLRYWLQTGFIWPSVRRGGRFYYTFQDLVSIRAALELLEAGIPVKRVRKALESLRAELPAEVLPTSRLRVASDGRTLAVLDASIAYEPESGQVLMSFEVASLGKKVAEVLSLGDAVPAPIDDGALGGATEPHASASAYQCFLDGCEAEDRGDAGAAESLFRRALELEPSMAAAHTNLANALYRKGLVDDARAHYEKALEHDPDQPEARFNLGNLLDELGETELAIAELRRVCHRSPDFADAHYNLGIILARVGGVAQARGHFHQYLELDPASEWASHARIYLASA
jgi:tetratricopeptide (TPR) repeat protein